ncbi:MAG: sensor histidine kinase [Limnohabitans sp.]
MMKKRLIGLSIFLSVVVLACLYWGQWIGPRASSIQSLNQAEFFTARPMTPSTRAQAVTLPHAWTMQDQLTDQAGIYQIRLPAVDSSEPYAISIARSSRIAEISFAGDPPLELEKLTGRLDSVTFAKLGRVNGGELIEIRVPQSFVVQMGIGPVEFGPASILERRAWAISVLRFIARSFSIALAAAVGILLSVTFLFRAKPLLLFVGYGAVAYAVQQSWVDVIGYSEADGIELATYFFLSTNVILSYSFALLAALDQKLKGLMVLAAIGLPLAAFFLFTQTGSLGVRRTLNIVIMIVWFGFAVVRCGPQLIRHRHWFLMVMVFGIGVRLCVSLFSSLSNDGRFGFYELSNHLLLVPVTVILMAVMLAKNFDQFFKHYEMINGRLREEVETYKEQLTRTSESEKKLAVMQAAEIERNHWMQEIHDGLGSHLIAARFLTDKIPDSTNMHAIKDSIDDSIEQLRILVDSLSTEQSSVPSLLGAMRYRMVNRFKATGLNVKWEVDPMIEAIEATPHMALNVQRIIQEAMTNVLKHAQAKTIRVHIFTQGTFLIVRVDDDGKGFDECAQMGGRGISNMKSRAEKFGGVISWTPLHPGTRVELRFANTAAEA